MIPGVRYGPWEPYPETPPYPRRVGVQLRLLTCARCGAILARQLTDSPDDPESSSSRFWPFPYETGLRSEMVLLATLSPRGLPRYGQQSRLRRGLRPRPIRQLRKDSSGSISRQIRRPSRVYDFGAPDPSIWFNPYIRLPCEVYCLNGDGLHLLTGQGPEGAPPADHILTKARSRGRRVC